MLQSIPGSLPAGLQFHADNYWLQTGVSIGCSRRHRFGERRPYGGIPPLALQNCSAGRPRGRWRVLFACIGSSADRSADGNAHGRRAREDLGPGHVVPRRRPGAAVLEDGADDPDPRQIEARLRQPPLPSGTENILYGERTDVSNGRKVVVFVYLDSGYKIIKTVAGETKKAG